MDEYDDTASSRFPQLRVWLCGSFEMAWRDPITGDTVAADASSGGRDRAAAISLLALLLCQPTRQAHRDWVMEQFWPDGSRQVAVHRLENIFSCLRKMLRPPGGGESLLRSVTGKKTGGPSYGLAASPTLWVDRDALLWQVEQAARMERFGENPLPFWERALVLWQQGPFLADSAYDPYADWIIEQRSRLEGVGRQCVHALARLFVAHYGEAGKAEALLLLRTYWQHYQTDEDVLRPLMELLGEQERYQEAEEYYQQLLVALAEQEPDEDGQPREADARTRDIREYLRTKQIQRERVASPQLLEPLLSVGTEPQEVQTRIYTSRALPSSFSLTDSASSLPSQTLTPAIIRESVRELAGQDMDIARRRILQQALGITSAALVTPVSALLHPDIVGRLSRALTKPSTIDETTLSYLDYRTDSYWQDRNSAALASSDLLSYVVEHLQKVTALLEGSLLPAVRTRLCGITGATAMLVGALLYDLSYYAEAREFYSAAIKAAQEALNPRLEAVLWGWMSFAWTYENNPRAALISIQKARSLAAKSMCGMVGAWLAAVEAEIHANLGDLDACLIAFEGTDSLEEHPSSFGDSYWVHFDRSLLAGYRGVCFRRLYRQEDTRTHPFLHDAQSSLIDALNRLNPTLMRRSPQYHIDIAATYIPQGDIELACNHALQATSIIAQIKAQTVLQRLLTLRKDLEPWKETSYVKNVDTHMALLLISGWHRDIA